jgi:mannose-6-phosphate isomerase-like protein (cupin superfamily)
VIRSTYAVQVPVAYEDALEVLGADPSRLFEELTARVADVASEVTHPLRLEVGGASVRRDVVIHVDPMTPTAVLRAVVPLRWRAAHGAAWFPEVDATLIVEPAPGELSRTDLTLRSERRPPAGAAGAAVDRIVGRRVADAVLHGLLAGLADRLEQLVAGAELSSRARLADAPPLPVDTAAAVRFSADAPPRTVLHAGADHDVALLGLEPWQRTVLPHDGVDVTVVVLGGHAELELGTARVPMTTGEVVVVPARREAVLAARGQRVTALAVEVRVPAASGRTTVDGADRPAPLELPV